MNTLRACIAQRLITLAGEGAATKSALYAPLTVYDKGLIVSAAAKVLYAGKYDSAQIPAGVQIEDVGEVTLVPAFVNAHTHIQLAHLSGRTHGGAGFAAWLASLIPLVREPLNQNAIHNAVRSIVHAGTAHVADFVGHGAALVGQAALDAGLAVLLCAEWFGMTPAFLGTDAHAHILPPRVRAVLEAVPASVSMVPAGHALYSTRHDVLQRAKAYCVEHRLPFALHLAESLDEVHMLTTGDGPLIDLYRDTVLPPDWRAPAMEPVALARHWGLLGAGTLAIHGVHCTGHDATLLAATGTSLCLCPRSNAFIGVGTAPVAELVRAGVVLCLGTDSLCSNSDMDVAGEALWLLDNDILPAQALLRMLTRNGAIALGIPHAGTLAPGTQALWAVLPEALADALPNCRLPRH